MNRIPEILSAIDQGDALAARELLPLVYDELRRIAAAKLAREAPGQTLQATALVHEAYLRVTGDQDGAGWQGKAHFFAAAAEAMRRILIERARRRATRKRGSQFIRTDLGENALVDDPRTEELFALDAALTRLESHDARAAQLVKLRYFSGLTHQEAAQLMGISRRSADRLWTLARAWLYREVAGL